jgi:hypothetical protein
VTQKNGCIRTGMPSSRKWRSAWVGDGSPRSMEENDFGLRILELRIALFNPQLVTRNAKSGDSDFLRGFAGEFLAVHVERIVRSQGYPTPGI